jgi:hypothetical protein
MVIKYVFPVLVFCTKRNLATLIVSAKIATEQKDFFSAKGQWSLQFICADFQCGEMQSETGLPDGLHIFIPKIRIRVYFTTICNN